MAIVLVIASILLVAGIKVMTAQQESAAFSSTKLRLEAAKQSLITYLGNNQRLPCPDTQTGGGPGALSFSVGNPPDGIENRTTAGNPATLCAGPFGVLPYSTLGLSRDSAMDGWENLVSYHIAQAPNNWTLTAAFGDTNTGNLTVNDRTPGGLLLPLSTTAVAVLVAHGRNGSGAFTIKGTRLALPTGADELENTNSANNLVYFRREYTENTGATGGAFDDFVMFVTAADLIAPLRRDGTLRNMNGATTEQIQTINNAIIGIMMGQVGCLTPANMAALGLPATTTNDPWGTAMVYTRAVTTLAASNANTVPLGSTGATIAITVTSSGPNRAVGGGDDITVSMTVGQMRGLLGTAYATKCP